MINLVFDIDPEPIELLSVKAVQAFLKLQIDGGAEFKSFEISCGPFSCKAYSLQECVSALTFLRIDSEPTYVIIEECL
jgi:hypothetical protein